MASVVEAMNILADIARHALPLVSLYRLQGSIPAYLLLTAFDLSLGLMVIVGTTRDRGDPTSVDPRSRWLVMRVLAVLVLTVFFAVVAAILTVPDRHAGPHHRDGPGHGLVGAWCRAQLLDADRNHVAARRRPRSEPVRSDHDTGLRGPPTPSAPVVGDLAADRSTRCRTTRSTSP